ncbi:3508_t:CDS:2, partial [Acaulospora morrowiae]
YGVVVPSSQVQSASPPIHLGEARPLEGPTDVVDIIGHMMQAVYRPEMVEYFMHRLELTSDNVLLRQFVNQGGLRIMKLYINDQTTTDNMAQILSVLEKIPFPYKDPIIESEIELNMHNFKTHDEELLSNMKKIQKIWGDLPCKHYHNNVSISTKPLITSVVSEQDVQAIKKIFDPDDSKGPSSKKRSKMKGTKSSSHHHSVKNGNSEKISTTESSPNKNTEKTTPSQHVDAVANESVESTGELPARPTVPDNTTSGNSPVASLDKQQFRDEFTLIVVEQCEPYKNLMEESTFNKHKERCINILYDKELRFFDKEMQRKDSRSDIGHYMNSIRNRVSKFLDEYMNKLVESIKKSRKEKESARGSTSVKREHDSEGN